MNYFLSPHDNLTLEYIEQLTVNYFRNLNGLQGDLREGKGGRKKQFERQLFLFVVFTLQEQGFCRKKYSYRKLGEFLNRNHSAVMAHERSFKKRAYLNDWTVKHENYVTNHYFNLLALFTGLRYYDQTKRFEEYRPTEAKFQKLQKLQIAGEFFITLQDYAKFSGVPGQTVTKHAKNHKLKLITIPVKGKRQQYVKIKR
jgi:hypothetical protein